VEHQVSAFHRTLVPQWTAAGVSAEVIEQMRVAGSTAATLFPALLVLAAVAGLRLAWAWHHRIAAPTLLLRAPDGLLTPDDCLMTQEEAEAMAHAIPDCRLVVVPGVNHYTILLGDDPLVRRELSAFLAR